MGNEPDIKALIEAWERGLITKEEFRMKMGFKNAPVNVVGTRFPGLPKQHPLGSAYVSQRAAELGFGVDSPQFKGLQNERNENEGY